MKHIGQSTDYETASVDARWRSHEKELEKLLDANDIPGALELVEKNKAELDPLFQRWHIYSELEKKNK
ncbi:hypothetical protein KEM56_004745 [Ascosphaera pollenicola]|nr:hypothetical protein KEM56_004745 [Ascosphaera pollenicola]